MPLTPKQQAYAEARLSGVGPSDAYRLAYDASKMSDKAISVEAARLESHPNVSLVLAEANRKALSKLDVTAERVLTEYARIAFADMRRFATVGAGGISLKDSADWTDDDAAAVAELGETTTKEGGSMRFKLHSKTAALDALAKHLRLLGNDDEPSENHLHLHVENLSIEELRAIASGR